MEHCEDGRLKDEVLGWEWVVLGLIGMSDGSTVPVDDFCRFVGVLGDGEDMLGQE